MGISTWYYRSFRHIKLSLLKKQTEKNKTGCTHKRKGVGLIIRKSFKKVTIAN